MKRTAIAAFLSAGMLLPAISAGSARSPMRLALEVGAETPIEMADDKNDKKVVVAEVLVMHATNDGKGIDPAIGELPQLKQPPFSAYDSYKLLERVTLELGSSGELKLPNGGKLTLDLKKIEAGKKGASRYIVDAQILKKNGDKFVSAEFNARENVHFFLAGPRHQKGILVLGIRVAPK